MATEKKKIITSYSRLSNELVELFEATYPDGFRDAIMSITKPSGERIYAVRLETEDTSYLVKVEVDIDSYKDSDEEEEDSRDDSYQASGHGLDGAKNQYDLDSDDDDEDYD